MKIPVKDRQGLVRDTRTNAIISTNSEALALEKKKKNIRKRNEQELLSLREDNIKLNNKVDSLEQKIDKILELLG